MSIEFDASASTGVASMTGTTKTVEVKAGEVRVRKKVIGFGAWRLVHRTLLFSLLFTLQLTLLHTLTLLLALTVFICTCGVIF